MPQPDDRCTTRPKELDYFIGLIEVLLTLDVVFSIVFRMNELQLRREPDIGFVEGEEEEGEDLADFDEQDGRLLIEF